eukprot:1652151-Lingulodinium_polyedra.AAC.1
MITFDGGSHKVDGLDVAGAAAVLWRRDEQRGTWVKRLTYTFAFPTAVEARAAEAWAAVAAMRVLQHPLARLDATLLSGDNLGVV